MLRLLILLMTTLSLSACLSTKPTTFPAEFANLDYELSDQDARRWAIASTQVEQCIYPNLTRIQREHFPKKTPISIRNMSFSIHSKKSLANNMSK